MADRTAAWEAYRATRERVVTLRSISLRALDAMWVPDLERLNALQNQIDALADQIEILATTLLQPDRTGEAP